MAVLAYEVRSSGAQERIKGAKAISEIDEKGRRRLKYVKAGTGTRRPACV